VDVGASFLGKGVKFFLTTWPGIYFSAEIPREAGFQFPILPFSYVLGGRFACLGILKGSSKDTQSRRKLGSPLSTLRSATRGVLQPKLRPQDAAFIEQRRLRLHAFITVSGDAKMLR